MPRSLMKKNRHSRSAYTHLRVFLAFTFCLAGFSLAITALGAWPDLTAAMRANSPNQSSATAKSKTKGRYPGGASMSVKSNSGSGTTAPNPATQTQPGSVPSNTVTVHTNALGQIVYSISPSHFDISPPLTELAKIVIPEIPVEERPELELPSWLSPNADRPDPVTQVAPPVRLPNSPLAPNAPSTGFNFAGITGSPTGGFPPDNNGSVGNDQYVETVNTRYQVWSLNRSTNVATSLLGPVNINTLWAGFGGACQTQNSGDPVVLYDKLANRWLISQFTSAASGGVYYQCVAISTTANAAGSYARYAFAVPNGNFGDYPHYGVWTDAYYVMAHNFTSSA